MSEPKTDTYDRLSKFMSMTPNQRDEALYLQCQRFKSILESEGLTTSMREIQDIMNGNTEEPGLPVRVRWMEERIKKLVKSNNKLQAAIYVATGIYIAVKFYFEFLAPPR